jgi:outer membrane protein TolC
MRIGCIVLLVLILPSFCYSQQRISLPDAINIALKNNPGIKIAQNNLTINTITNSSGFAGGQPVINGLATDQEQTSNIDQSLSSGQQIFKTGASTNTAAVSVSANMLIYNGGRVGAAKKRLDVNQQQSEIVLTARGLSLISSVIFKYYDIVRQQSYAKTLERSIDVSEKKLDIVKAKKEIGVANNADLFQSQLDLNAQLQALQTQQLIIDQGKTDLLTLLALRADSIIHISDTIIVDKTMQLDSILNHLDYNPDVLIADKQIQINEFLEKETAAQRYPSISANGGLVYGRTQAVAGNVLFNQNYGPYVGVNLSVPISNGHLYKKQSQIASINTNSAKLLKDTIILAFKSNAVKYWQAYTNNLKQLQTQQKSYELSLQLLDLILQKFQLGQATIIDVKQAQQSFEDAANQLVNLSYAAKVSEVQLKKLINKITY